MINKKKIVDKLDFKFDGRSLRKEIKNDYNELYLEIINHTIGDNFISKVFSLVNNITEHPTCKECEINKTKFFSYKKGWREFCCGSCSELPRPKGRCFPLGRVKNIQTESF